MFVMNIIFNQVVLNFKYFLTNKTRTFFLISLPFLLTTIPIIFIPTRTALPMIFEMGIIYSSGIAFISLSINMRESSLYDNMKTTKNNKWSFNISILITMLFISFLEAFIIASLIQLYSISGFLLWDWFKYFSPGINNGVTMFNELFYVLLYFVFISTTVLFAICFFFSRVIKNEKAFYTIIFILGFLTIFFGATFNNYFAIEYIHLEPWDTKSYMNFEPMWSLFPETFYIPFLFFLFFAPGELLQPYIIHSLTSDIHVNFEIMDNSYFSFFRWETVANLGSSNLPHTYKLWNALWIDPLIFVVVFGFLGVLKKH